MAYRRETPEASRARKNERHCGESIFSGDAAGEQQHRERRHRRAETLDERGGVNNDEAASEQQVKHSSL